MRFLLALAVILSAAPVALAEPIFFGRTGDVVTVDLKQTFGGSTFDALQFDSLAGGVARTSDDYGGGPFSQTGRFYFLPDVGLNEATSLDDRTTKGFQGVVTGTASVDGQTQPFSITVAPAYSGVGPRAVISDGDRAIRARQQHRLNYLGFPAEGGAPLGTDGFIGPISTSAIKLFQASLFNTNPSARPGNFGPQTTLWANATNAPRWLERVESRPRGERWATSWTIDTIAATNAANPGGLFITALSARDGYGSDAIHATHQAGLDIDVRIPNSVENFGNGSLSADERTVVNLMEHFVNSTPFDARVDRFIISNNDIKDALNARLGFSLAIGDSSGGHLNHLHVDIEQTLRVDPPVAAFADVQYDGYLDVFDVLPFVEAFAAADADAFARVVPDGDYLLADFTLDGRVGTGDVLPFIDALRANGVTREELAPVYALIPEPMSAAWVTLAASLLRRRRRS